MVLTDSASRKNRRPDLVIQCFQVIADAIDPVASMGNLFAKEFSRALCSDEGEPMGPEVIGCVSAARRARETLTGATTCPKRSIVGNAGLAKGERPASDAGEEMALRIASEVVGADIDDASPVNVPRRDVSGPDEIFEPVAHIGV